MATALRNAAITSVNKGQTSSFYGKDKINPVLQSLKSEMNLYMENIKKKTAKDNRKNTDDPTSRTSETLFALWNKYEPKLPREIFEEKLLEMGDFLVSIKEYRLALWQCYNRFLTYFGDVDMEQITDVNTFKNIFFKEGLESSNPGSMFRALMGKCTSLYQAVKSSDPKLQNSQSVDRCVQILTFLRLVLQVALPTEKLCWLVYNGTIHIYSICRHLMSLGHCSRAMEYLLWCSVCMETSVPLLSVKYLPWRTTLYTAVCQCYYDVKAVASAESFARRGLAKINELSQLENMSLPKETPHNEVIFRQATVKMAIMVFKRTVFESRRKPKNVLRPKTRANLKDAQGLPWPRTSSEKLLSDMFEGSAAQFLCILESLSDTNRRTLISSPPASDTEPEVLDVYAELIMAAQDILAGGGGNLSIPKTGDLPGAASMRGINNSKSLIAMASLGEDGVPLSAAVKLVKLTYCYEQWDAFDVLVDRVLNYIRVLNDNRYENDEKALEILIAMEKVNSNRRHKRQMSSMEDGSVVNQDGIAPPPSQLGATSTRSLSQGCDDLIHLAEVLMTVVNGNFNKESLDLDMMVDAGLFLWRKCKAVFERYQTGAVDNAKYLQKMQHPGKWVYILDIVHHVLSWCGISAVDPALAAEVVLRLGLVLESAAQLESQEDCRSQMKGESMTDVGGFSGEASHTMASHISVQSASILSQGTRDQLIQARDVLELGLENVSKARQAVAHSDGKSIADIGWVKELNEELFKPEAVETPTEVRISEEVEEITSEAAEEEGVKYIDPAVVAETGPPTSVWNTIKDLHLELLMIYHRVCLKLAELGPDPALSLKKPYERQCTKRRMGSTQQLAVSYVETPEELSARCNRSLISKALLNMQRANVNRSQESVSKEEQTKLLQEAVSMITRAQADEKRLYLDNSVDLGGPAKLSAVPSPPVLTSRTENVMVFRPAPYKPTSGEKVAWYSILGRSSTGSNVKVRLNDNSLSGTGQQVPAFNCELIVSGLVPFERYVFALAAYTTEGKLIGDSVGEMCRPIVASHPLPILTTWAFLSQIAYQVGCYDIALQACEVLWDYFVAPPPPPEGDTYFTITQKDFRLTLYKVNKRVVKLSSPVLLRQTLTTLFISVDINVRKKELFCDILSNSGPLYNSQICRLEQCEKMLLALDLAGWLNEANLALQGVVQCYGLLAPLIFYKIPSIPVMQVLEYCHAVLQEIPAGLRQKRPPSIANSLHHMTACITYYLAKVLRTLGQKTLATNLNDAGRRLLSIDTTEEKEQKPIESSPEGKGEKDKVDGINGTDGKTGDGHTAVKPTTLLKKRRTKKQSSPTKEEMDGPVNEELRALEAHMVTLSRNTQADHELTGFEDPNVLHAYITYLPSKIAHREVVKFKRRGRYLEFLVQLVQKALGEGQSELALDWSEDALQWITKRNEQIIGPKTHHAAKHHAGGHPATGEETKKFAAAMVEYSKDKDKHTEASPRHKGLAPHPLPASSSKVPPVKTSRRRRYKAINVTVNMSDSARQNQEDAEIKALDKLARYFPAIFRNFLRRRRLRKVTNEELPYRVQLNVLQGVSQFNSLLQKLEKREKVLGSSANNIYRTTFLDHEWFTFETTGTLVVGWEGGPTAIVQHAHDKSSDSGLLAALDLAPQQENKTTGIEIAAAAATSKPSVALDVIAEALFEDTPRTYRSDIGPFKNDHKHNKAPEPSTSTLSTKVTLENLRKTFHHFTRAVVLAHRGRHWTQLQNVCRALWNCTHTAMLRAYTPTSSSKDVGLVTMEMLRSLMWEPLCIASQCVLDMIDNLQAELEAQANKSRVKKSKLGKQFDSWMGEIADEKGGASLKFESGLDDLSVVDMRWVRRLVMRSLEVLYHEQKWERLADIALRFSAISNNRYAEQILPLLVHAQRFLIEQVRLMDGPLPPQPHYKLLLKQMGGIFTAKDYIKSQLRFDLKPASAGDPVGESAHYTDETGLRLVSVPLDVKATLENFRVALDRTNYTSRALQHSRKLMILYLSGQQNVESGANRDVSHVDFASNTEKPQPVMPPDLKTEEFAQLGDVQSTPLPKSQLHLVISSYDKTIAILLAKKQRSQAGQAAHELGNLHYHSGNIRAAYKWWCEGLDIVLNQPDSLHTWRESLYKKEETCKELLARAGLWGCVLGGILASKIAQYVITSDLGLRLEACFLSGYLFKSLFSSSLPHPTADRDYALYEVGEGCEVTNLVPGIDLLSDKFRADGRQLVAALRWVTEELARGRYNLFILPLLTLYQYITTYVCRDLQRSVDGRILKVRVLADSGLFLEACITLQRLLQGERLPHTGDSHFRQVESKLFMTRFNTSKPLTDPNNIKVLENILDKRLSSNLSMLYGPHMTCHLLLAQAHLLVTLADSIPVIPVFDSAPEPSTKTQSTVSISQVSKGVHHHSSTTAQPSIKRGGVTTSAKSTDKDGDKSEDDPSPMAKRLSESRQPLTMELIKGTVLGVADQMVTSLSDVLIESAEREQGVENLVSAELELVVLCRLEQAAIARQKHHAPMAARIVLSAMKMLQNSDIFKTFAEPPPAPSFPDLENNGPSSLKLKSASSQSKLKEVQVTETDNTQYTYQNFQSRSRLDARLWLQCRLALVKSLLLEIRGLGDVKGSSEKVLTDLADCRQYCAEGVAEAKACGDVEMQAEFFMQGAQLNIMEGQSMEQTLHILKDVREMLTGLTHLSLVGENLLSLCVMLHTDLQTAIAAPGTLQPSQILASYLQCQDILLKQMEDLGERIQRYQPEGERSYFSTPASPIQNLYLPHMVRLAQVKLRIGYTMARQVAASSPQRFSVGDIENQWGDCLSVLMTALQLSQVSVNRQAHIEADILLNIGKVERQLVMLGRYQPRSAVATLIDGIKTSFANNHDLGLIRQCYLEIALTYLYSSGSIGRVGSAVDGQSDSDGEGSLASRPSSNKPSAKRWKSKKERSMAASKEEIGNTDRERRAAWIAVRCAAAVAQAQRSRSLLPGDTNVSSQQLTTKAVKELPEFIPLDLLSPYVLGKKKKIFKSEIEEELSSLADVKEDQQVETYDEEVTKVKEASGDLSLIHLLGYQSLLQRLCCTHTIPPASVGEDTDDKDGKPGSLIGFDLGFISHAQMYQGLNSEVVRTMLNSSVWAIRLNHLHNYLSHNVPVYASTCCAVYPPDSLELPLSPEQSATELLLTYPSYSDSLLENVSSGELQLQAADSKTSQDTNLSIPRTSVPPGSRTDLVKPIDRAVTSASENDLCIQWYQPSVEESDLTRKRLMLLYCISKKGGSASSGVHTGQLWVSMSDLVDLHDRLAVLTQKGEISLVEKPKKEATPTPTPTPAKGKKSQRIKALSPKVQRDEHLENLLRQCIEDCGSLLSGQIPEAAGDTTVPETIQAEFPFEVTKANLKNFEMLFDPSYGLTLKGGDLMTWVTKQFP